MAGVVLRVGRRAIDAASSQHAPGAEELAQVVAVDAKRARGFGDRRGVEHLDRVVEKSVSKLMSGHVYNFQTSASWYVAQDLVVHNCRCYADPDFSGILDRV
jgi:hypothetical protein